MLKLQIKLLRFFRNTRNLHISEELKASDVNLFFETTISELRHILG